MLNAPLMNFLKKQLYEEEASHTHSKKRRNIIKIIYKWYERDNLTFLHRMHLINFMNMDDIIKHSTVVDIHNLLNSVFFVVFWNNRHKEDIHRICDLDTTERHITIMRYTKDTSIRSKP